MSGAAVIPVLGYAPGGGFDIEIADGDAFALWAAALGAWGSHDGDGNTAGYERDTRAFSSAATPRSGTDGSG